MTRPNKFEAAACLVMVVDKAVWANIWRDRLSPLVEVRMLLTSEASDGAALESAIADWPPERPWALFVAGTVAPGVLALAADIVPAPSRVFVGSVEGILADPPVSAAWPVTVVLSEDASDRERARATSWTPVEQFPGGLVVRLVPVGQEPPAACHPYLAQGVREDLSLP